MTVNHASKYSESLSSGGLGPCSAGPKVNSVITKSTRSAFKSYSPEVHLHKITGSALKALTQLGLENREGKVPNGSVDTITHQRIERAARMAPFWKNQGKILIKFGDPRGFLLLEYVKRLSNFYEHYRNSI
jgi:hypothetical protein